MTSEHAEAKDEARAAAEGRTMDRLIDRLIERIGGHSGAEAAFGEPVERGELTVVPVARLRWFVGAGAGSAPGMGSAGGPTGEGSGGGAGVLADPVGYLEIGPSGATFRPIVDPYPRPLFLLAAGVTTALVLRALARLLRG
jgi:hypothetical protein